MFQFPRLPSYSYVFTIWYMGLTHVSFLIRKSPDLWLCAPTRSLSQLITSFIGSWCQGIHHAPFVAWPFACLFVFITSSTTIFACSRTKVLLTAQIFCILVLKPTKLHNLSFVIKTLYNHHKEYLFLACCILYTLLCAIFKEHTRFTPAYALLRHLHAPCPHLPK